MKVGNVVRLSDEVWKETLELLKITRGLMNSDLMREMVGEADLDVLMAETRVSPSS